MPELIFIAIIALVVLGPQRLPGALREVAKFIAQLRGLASELTSQFSEEIAMIEELDPRKLINEVTQPINDLTKPLPEKKSTEKKSEEKKPDKPKSTSAAATTANKAETDKVEKKSDGSSTPEDAETKDESGGAYKSSNGANGTDAKKEPQTQTDPSNVASTEPYKNRTPNLNVIKRPSKDEPTGSTTEPETESDIAQPVADQSTSKPFASAQLASGRLPTDQVEENQIAPPAMQEKIAQAKLDQHKSTKAAAEDKSSDNNSDKPTTESVNSDSIENSSDTSTKSVAES